MWFQWFSLAGLLLFTTEFIVQFILNAIPGTTWYQNATATNGLELTPVYDMRGQVRARGQSFIENTQTTLIRLPLVEYSSSDRDSQADRQTDCFIHR